jgi:hypothetical protein
MRLFGPWLLLVATFDHLSLHQVLGRQRRHDFPHSGVRGSLRLNESLICAAVLTID